MQAIRNDEVIFTKIFLKIDKLQSLKKEIGLTSKVIS